MSSPFNNSPSLDLIVMQERKYKRCNNRKRIVLYSLIQSYNAANTVVQRRRQNFCSQFPKTKAKSVFCCFDGILSLSPSSYTTKGCVRVCLCLSYIIWPHESTNWPGTGLDIECLKDSSNGSGNDLNLEMTSISAVTLIYFPQTFKYLN